MSEPVPSLEPDRVNEQQPVTAANLRRVLEFRVAILQRRNSELSPTATTERKGNQKTAAKFRRMQDLLTRTGGKSIDETVETLTTARDHLDDSMGDIENEQYADYMTQRSSDLSSTIDYVQDFDPSALQLGGYKAWDQTAARQPQNVQIDYHTITRDLEPQQKSAKDQGDETEAFRLARIHDEVVQLVQPDRVNEVSSLTVAEGLAHMVSLYHTRKAAMREAKPHLVSMKRGQFMQVENIVDRSVDRVFPDAQLHPNAKTELINARTRIFTAESFIGQRTAQEVFTGIVPDIDELAWNDVTTGINKLEEITNVLAVQLTQAQAKVSERIAQVGPNEKSVRQARDQLIKLCESYQRVTKLAKEFERRKKWQLSPDEPPIDDPVFQAEEAKGEPWVNKARERVYHRIVAEIDTVLDGSGTTAGEYLKQVILEGATNPDVLARANEILTDDVLRHIEINKVTSDSLSALANREITRPVIRVHSEAAYQALERVFIGDDAGGTHGIHLSGFINKHPLWSKVGLVVSKAERMNTVIHEMRHSVDPFIARGIEQRTGYNNLLCELFAEYVKVITADKKTRNHVSPEFNQAWQEVESLVQNKAYYDQYSKTLPESKRIDYETYKQTVKQCVAQMRALTETQGLNKAQRTLAQSESIQQFLAVAA